MSHPRALSVALGCLVALSVLAGSVRPAAAARVSAVGLLDYTKRNFKIGDWVRYKVDVSTNTGYEDENLQEVRIVGEDTYRGEKCFWVETWYGPDAEKATYDLTLVSYEIFKDVAPDLHYRNYMRLMLIGFDNEGQPEMNDLQRSNPNAPPPDLRPYRGNVDTLGVEKIETAKGAFDANLVRLTRRLSRTHPQADSTINRINDTTRQTWFTRKVPVTSVAREQEMSERKIQSYPIGAPSTTAPILTTEVMTRNAVVVDWGTGASSALLQQWRDNRGLLRTKATQGVGLEDEASPR